MVDLMELRWLRKDFRFSSPCFLVTKVSSTYRSHTDGFFVAMFMVSSSKNSMYMLASMGDSGYPMAAPSVCS